MEIHVSQSESAQIKDQTDFVVRISCHHPEGLNVVQDISLHGPGRLLMWIVKANSDDVDWVSVFVGASNIALSRAVLHDECFFIHSWRFLQPDALAPCNNGLVNTPFTSPVDCRDEHVDCLQHIPVSGPEESENSSIGMIGKYHPPEETAEALWRLVLEVMLELMTSVWSILANTVRPAESQQMHPCLLQLAFFVNRQVAKGTRLRLS